MHGKWKHICKKQIRIQIHSYCPYTEDGEWHHHAIVNSKQEHKQFVMKMELLGTLCVGVGWIVGVTTSMIIAPIGVELIMIFFEAIGNTFVFGFPGFVMFMIAIILSLKDDANEGLY